MKKKKYNTTIPKYITFSFKILQTVSNKATVNLAKRLFITPIKYKIPEREIFMFENSKIEDLHIPKINKTWADLAKIKLAEIEPEQVNLKDSNPRSSNNSTSFNQPFCRNQSPYAENKLLRKISEKKDDISLETGRNPRLLEIPKKELLKGRYIMKFSWYSNGLKYMLEKPLKVE